jgi:hypothetical protein
MTSLNNRRDSDGMGDDNDDVIGASTLKCNDFRSEHG